METKFRGQRVDNKEWVYGYYVFDPEQYGYPDTHFIVKRPAKGEWFEVIPETVGQFTGLKDKEGTEIYEGDVILCKSPLIVQGFLKGVIEWIDANYVMTESGNINYKHYLGMLKDIEVIGNKWEVK